ncbi:MAG: hypothetical protein HY208_04965 [Nitrospirae bacterium]|nr:hypothetical protein [Nitrospirota bacterium]
MKNMIGLCALMGCLLIVSCASILRIQYDEVPANSLHLGEAMVVFHRSDVLKDESKPTYAALLAAGIKDSDIKDGSLVFVRIYCCGGPNERVSAPILYVPSGLEVKQGDIVEFVAGRRPQKGDVGLLNIATRIVQRYDERSPSCRWDPPDNRLWQRVLYCDWMQESGWVKQGGIAPAWFKPASKEQP